MFPRAAALAPRSRARRSPDRAPAVTRRAVPRSVHPAIIAAATASTASSSPTASYSPTNAAVSAAPRVSRVRRTILALPGRLGLTVSNTHCGFAAPSTVDDGVDKDDDVVADKGVDDGVKGDNCRDR